MKQFNITKGDDKNSKEVTYTIDPTQKPPHMDIVPLDGSEKGKKLLGIYTLDKDDLKICIAGPEQERPTEVASKEGVKTGLLTLKRQKK
jgi:uncharacterized protein (TIGR03067 family)